jgi:hypothetical protein
MVAMFLFALFLPPALWGGSYVDFAYIVKPFWSCGRPLGLVTNWSGSSRTSNLLRSKPEPAQPPGWEYKPWPWRFKIPHVTGQSEPAPTSAPCKMDDHVWT